MSGPQVLSAREAMVSSQGRVLLVNPPVVDSRYPWVKWNQPLDLLKLGTAVSQERGCEVRLYDFMLPDLNGAVARRKSLIEDVQLPGEPIRWHFGQSWESFDAYLDGLADSGWKPDMVWITTLASFWWQTVPLVANRVKNKLRRPPIVLCGNYPAFETKHAVQFCPNVDMVIQDHSDLDLVPWSADFSLYGGRKLGFCALDLRSPNLLDEIECALGRGTSHFVFFNESLFADFDTRLKVILQEVVQRRWKLQFHGICGVEIRQFPTEDTQLLADAHFSELHFEPALDEDGVVDEPLYRRVIQACEKARLVSGRGAGWESRLNSFSGFLWIGRPNDDLDKLVWNALKLLQLVGMVIPKPYSPTPGTDDYSLLLSQIGQVEPEDVSPHRLSFAGLNGIDRNDYEDLYRMTAFLNSRVRGSTFDFLGNTFLAEVVRESLAGRRWAV